MIDRRAFSVLELLIASLIVGLAMVPIITLFSGGAREAAFDEHFVAAQGLGISLVERAVEELTTGGFKTLERSQTASVPGLGEKSFAYELRVGPVDAQAWLWLVQVKITWRLPTDPSAITHSFILERLVSRPDASFTGVYPFRRMVENP